MIDMDEVLNWAFGLIPVFFILAVCVALYSAASYLIKVAEQERAEWEVFSNAHHCKITQKVEASTDTGFGVTASGKPGVVFVTHPEKTAYLCDDGVTYWR